MVWETRVVSGNCYAYMGGSQTGASIGCSREGHGRSVNGVGAPSLAGTNPLLETVCILTVIVKEPSRLREVLKMAICGSRGGGEPARKRGNIRQVLG